MVDLANVLAKPPFSIKKQEKAALFQDVMQELTGHHYRKCDAYRKMLDVLGYQPDGANRIEGIPPIPVRLFKEYDLLSVDESQIVKTMTSSGTTGQGVSRIFLDRTTATNQTKVLAKIVSSVTGKKRLPMLIVDSHAVIKDRNMFSARGAGILGFSMLGRDLTYALDEDMRLDIEKVEAFLERNENEKVLVFGFTFIIWEKLHKYLLQAGYRLPLEDSVVIHGGGWKKLGAEAVDDRAFKRSLKDTCGISEVYNYYGMVEQTGSIFMECEAGYLHASIFSDILIRDPQTFRVLGCGEEGLIQLVSVLPLSYPGHSILTEDLGEVVGEDDCSCGWLGKYFVVRGRLANAEIRGCSDTYAAATE